MRQNRRFRFVYRWMAGFILLTFCLGATPIGFTASCASSTGKTEITYANNSYGAYRNTLADKPQQGYTSTEDLILLAQQAATSAQKLLYTAQVSQPGLYQLSFSYRYRTDTQLAQNSSRTERFSFALDGKVPYQEAENINLPRLWVNKSAMITDELGNDISPDQTGLDTWQQINLRDREGQYDTPLLCYLTSGHHTLSIICSSAQAIEIKDAKLLAAAKLPTYEAYRKACLIAHPDAAVYTGDPIVLQGEAAAYKSECYLLPQNDVTSPLTVPYDPAKIKLNTFGGSNWKLSGETVTWVLDNVPKAGFYQLNIRYRQIFYEGVSVYRRLYVNGKVPFDAANTIPFGYADGWQCQQLGGQLIYLEQGRNTLTLECTLGGSAKLLYRLSDTVRRLNEIYRSIIMITGSVPDNNRDYALEEQIPGLLDQLKEARNGIAQVADLLEESVANAQSAGAAKAASPLVTKIRTMATALQRMIDKPREIGRTDRLDAFKSNISLAGTWLSMFREQPLEIDAFTLSQPQKASHITANFWEETVHRTRRFIASFTENYASLGGTGNGNRNIRVWMQAGRDQASVLKQQASSSFTPNHKIGVQLELVTGSIIEATLAGNGPDVALSRADTDPVNFAMRDALTDLSEYPDFDTVTKPFAKGSIIPFTYKNGVYALPERFSFSMMFCRTDVLTQLSLTPPKTWDEMMKKVYPVLSRNNMDIGIGAMGQIAQMNASNIFTNLLYQMGGSIYDKSLQKTALDTPVAYDAFGQAVQLYRDYLLPREYDAMSRFRTGEMPILLANYTFYNTLSITVPELDGLWEMLPIPGVLRDGQLHTQQAASVTAAVIFKHAKDQSACWEFLKWWVSTPVQSDFGMKIEALLGSAGRYDTANLDALTQLPWTQDQLDRLGQQIPSCIFVEQLPGSYFTSRAINSAFMTCVLNGKNPTEQLLYWSEQINRELVRKQQEFANQP